MSRSIKHPPAPDRFTKRNRTAGHAKAVKVEKVDAVSILFDLLDSSNTRVVFWVCPKGCCGAVAWSDDKTDATCQVCGVRKSDNAQDQP